MKNLIALIGLFVLVTSATMNKNNPSKNTSTEDLIKNETFVEFLSHFEKKELPFSIGLEELHSPMTLKKHQQQSARLSKKQFIRSPISNSEFIPEARMGRMSRMGPPELIPVGRFYPNEKMIAVIYSSKQRFGSPTNKNYNIVIYDIKGNVLPHSNDEFRQQTISLAQTNIEETMTGMIDKKGRIWKNTYKNMWKKNVQEKGIIDNEIIDFKIANTEVFSLNKQGEIEQLKEVPVTAKASLK